MSDDGSDVEMHSAVSRQAPTPVPPLSQAAHSTTLEVPGLNTYRAGSPVPMVVDEPVVDEPVVDEPVASEPSFDLLHRIPGMYRLLDLVQERGSGGVVDKIIIAQESIKAFANKTHPGSYRSDIQVDFKALDQHIIRPRGIYGSASAIVEFLDTIGCMEDEVRGWLLRPRDEYSGVSRPTLRPGLYLVDPVNDDTDRLYVVFWPEDGTWQDGAISSVSRNRVTFMRYLTKLCDQIDCLISDEHSSQLLWKDEDATKNSGDDEYSSFDDRMFGYTVEQTNEEEESAEAEDGFIIRHRSIEQIDHAPEGYPANHGLEVLQPRLVVGETTQAIMETRFIPEDVKVVRLDDMPKTLALKDQLSTNRSPIVVLKDNIDRVSLAIVLEHGLWERCGGLQREWKDRLANASRQRDKDKTSEKTRMRGATAGDKVALDSGMVYWMAKQAAMMYPVISEHRLFQAVLPDGAQVEYGECETAIAKIESWLDQHADSKAKLMKSFDEIKNLEPSPKARYTMLKRQLRQVVSLLERKDLKLSDEDVQRLADLVIVDSEKRFKDGVNEILTSDSKGQGDSGVVWNYTLGLFVGGGSQKKQNSTVTLPLQDDPSFAQCLEIWTTERPRFEVAINELKEQMTEAIRRKIKSLSSSVPAKLQKGLQEVIDEDIRTSFESRREKEEADAWNWLRGEVKRRLSNSIPKNNNGTKLVIEAVSCISTNTFGYAVPSSTFHIKGWISSPKKAGFEYTLFPFQVKQDDMLAISSDPGHLCKPIVRAHGTQEIFLPVTASVRFIRLLEKDRAFVIIEEPGLFRVYLESIDYLASTISQGKAIKTFYSEKVGVNPFFALDETRRFLAILGTTGPATLLHIYAYDLVNKSLNARGSAENLTRWYPGIPQFAHLLFVSGTEELLLVEKGGLCRIFSLVTANFRPSNLRLAGKPESAFSSSDGACLVLKILDREVPRLLCYHWASFGSREGTEIPWPTQIPSNAPMVVSAVGNRQGTHIIFMARREGFCQSLRVRITSKSSEFAFRSNINHTGQSGASKNTVNNSLIDCHAEVWTRFPVNAAIVKTTVATALHHSRSVLFVSSAASDAFAPYFHDMIRNFEYQTRKPTKDILKQTIVEGSQDWKGSSPNIPTSELQIGDWLVGLFCLIPIHLAVTRSNRFIPLKDGVDSPQFEHSLLGANVAQISEALSFGWYESIFSSYLANKPVKVVTSMGEQSVGKSFALNHFVDTSFAGSAMRCTEGVWLSVTPTKDYLVVAMDFEGVHSIERSAQEDTLLVLLNAAISNFVLFRNNFALSRDITGLFNSFQSCTKVLNPKENPSLFHSTLGIIIKDVIDSDTKEIVNEFQQKFQRIVQKERADNFISKLHRGKLDIIPWPVIESARFYDLFVGLKKRLDRQSITHKHAGAFLGVLKMLMAKLKANDWGALDQNLAVQRAQQLTSLLPFALAFGTTDPVNDEPLKNYDTDEQLDNTEQRDTNDSLPDFFLEGLSHPIHGRLSLDSCLTRLRMRWENRKERYSMTEREFVDGYNDYLRILAEARVTHVRDWIAANTSRFGEKAEVTSLRRTFDQLSKELRASAVLCGSKCFSCGLLCLEHKQHEGDHNCMTDHKCPEICGFADEHEGDVACGLPAGHIGRHVCSGAPHLCGMQCQMYDKNGCLTSCTKPMDHDDSEGHQCAAGLHTCGEPCSLVQEDGTRLCHRVCNQDCRIDHERHTCDRSLSCPIKCQLCNSYCAVGDHFHALKPNAVHLCGQKHPCDQLCELDGVCEINTTPQSIESTFVGRHATFQYTKYSQEARRLHCVVSLGPDQLKHDGPHVHSNEPNPFHYCEERCKYCGYYCTHPLGHSQPEHHTNHGSMAQTEWFIEGDDDAILEVQGRKYATGDSGAPMLCSLVCEALGRHVHVDSCRPDEDGNCVGADLEHINSSGENKDWITHRLYWARSGFEDPYSQEKRDDFVLCDHRCPGPEHDADDTRGAVPSYCTLPLFHGTPDPSDVPPLGHISNDGHAYQCKNPALMQRAFHIFFVLDRSGSMTWTDRQPLPNSPVTQRIIQLANNRFGAVISSLYGFWTAREAALRGAANAGQRRDAYSIISFDHNAAVTLSNDTTSDSDQLLEKVLGGANMWGGTNYTAALETVQAQMESSWTNDRSPVVIFLSDGECDVEDATIYDLCHTAVRLGKSLSFHSVSFGEDGQSHYLRRMATIASEVYDNSPADPLAPAGVNPCTFSSALDTVQLASTFLSLAESLKNPRAALSHV